MLSTLAPRSLPRRAFRPRLNAVCSALALLALHSSGFALPQGGTPTFGQTTVKTDGSQMTIVQGSDRAGIDWRSFSIGTGEGVSIRQPDARSTLFNRVLGTDPSLILGKLQSNGRVFLSNPRGVVFGQGSRVDVGSLVATTLSLSDEAMQAGRFDLRRGDTAPGELTQAGQIHATGTVALVSPSLMQRGSIEAPRIGLAAAESVKVDVEGDGLVFFNVNTDSLDTRLQVLGSLKADGGLADLRAQARAGFADTVLNMDGIVQARSAGLRNGRIHVDGGSTGITAVRGTLDASGLAAGETGGSVTVLGDKVGLFDAARVNASGAAGGGTLLVGGNYQGKGLEHNASAAYVGPEVVLRADAVERGSGGRAIVWSDDSTRFYGAISARGGAQQGDGGFAEVSGKAFLDFAGTADLRAARGRVGTLLLDPSNLDIMNGPASDDAGFPDDPPVEPFTPDADTAVLTWATINAALGLGDVLVQTTGSGGGLDGKITIKQNSTPTGFSTGLQGGNALTFDADGALAIEAVVRRASSGALIFKATEGITSTTGGRVFSANGDVEMTSTGVDGINLKGLINSGGGDVTLRAEGVGANLSLEADINAGTTGTVNLRSINGNIELSPGKVTAKDLVARASGSVSLASATNVITGNLAGFASDFAVNATGSLTVGSVDGANGVVATGDITLAAAANVSVDQPLSGGSIRLQAGSGDVTQKLGADIAATTLLAVKAGDAIDLGDANVVGNGLDNTAVLALNAAGNVLFREGGVGYTIGDATGGVDVAAVQGLKTTGTNTTLELNTAAGEVVQQAGQDIAAPKLLLRGNAQYTLTNEANAVATLAAATGTGAIRYVNANALAVGAVTPTLGGADILGITRTGDVSLLARAGNLSLARNVDVDTATLRLQAAAGNVTSNTGVTASAGALGARASGDVRLGLSMAGGSVSAEGGNVRLNSADGDYSVGAVGMADRNIIRSDGSQGVPIFQAVDGLQAATTVELNTAAGAVSQAADHDIGADNLLLRGDAQYTLANAGNAVDTLAADRGAGTGVGAIRYADASTLSVGSVTPVGGGTAVPGMDRTGDVSLHTVAGNLGLAQGIDVDLATLRLQAAAGNVTSSSGATASAGVLGVRASGTVNLAIAMNGGSVSAEGADVRLASANTDTGYSIAAVSDGDTHLVNTGGALGVNIFEGVDGLRATTTIELDAAGGAVAQLPGRDIAAANLLLRGNGQYTLTNAGNAVATLAADGGAGDGSGAIRYVDSSALGVNQVTPVAGGSAVSGISRTGDVSLRTVAGDLTLTRTAAVDGGTLRLQASAGNVSGSVSADKVGARASGNVDLGIDVRTASAEGAAVRLTSGGGYDIASVSAGDSDIINDDASSGGNIFDGVSGVRATTTVELNTAGGAVTQLASIAAANLLLRGAAAYTLTNAGNAVSTIAADTGGGTIRYADADALTVGAVSPLAGGAAVEGITRSGDVTLKTLSQGLTLAAGVDVTGATLRLQAATGIEQSGGVIHAAAVGARGGSSVSLLQDNVIHDDAGDTAGVVAGEAASGSFKLANTQDTQVAVVSEDAGLFDEAVGVRSGPVSSIDSDLTLRVTGTDHDLLLRELVSAGSGGTVRLHSAAGSIGQSAASITTGNLLATAPGGSVVLASAGNTIGGQLAGLSAADFGVRAASQLTVGTVNDDLSTAVVGLSASGNIVLTSSTSIAIDEALTTPGGVGLETGGAITVAANIGASRAAADSPINRLVLRGDSFSHAGATISANRVAVDGLDAASVAEAQTISNRVAATNVGDYQFRLATGDLIVPVVGDVSAGPAAGAGPITVGGVSGITAGEVRLQADDGSVLQEPDALALIQATTLLSVKASQSIELNQDNLAGSGASNAAVLALYAQGSIVFKEGGGGYTLGAVAATGAMDAVQGAQTNGPDTTLELTTTGGEVLQQAGANLAAPQLLLRGAARYTLTNVGNAVGTLAADSDGGLGLINYVDADALSVGAVTPGSGGAAVDGIVRSSDVALRTMAGDLTLLRNIDVGAHTLRLQAVTGSIEGNEVGGGQVIAQTVGARALESVELALGSTVASVSAEGANVLLVSPDSYEISAVSDADRNILNTDSTSGSAVFEVVDGIRASSTIELDTGGGAVSQQAGRDVTAAHLLLRGNAGYSLTNEGNQVTTLAVTTGAGAISYVNADTLEVGSAVTLSGDPEVLGITRTEDVSLRAQAGDIELARSANVGTATLRLQAAQGRVFGRTAIAGELGARAFGDVDLDILVETVSARSVSGSVRLASAGDYTVVAVGNSTYNVLLASDAPGAAVFLATDGIQAATTIELDTASGEVTQQAARDLTADNLLLRGGAAYSLTNERNLVGKLAADTGAGAIRYVNAESLQVDAVEPVNSGAVVLGIARTGDVALHTLEGDLSLVENADVAGATLRLQSAQGNVLSATSGRTGLKGTAMAGTLGARAANRVDLDVAVDAASASGSEVRLNAGTGYTLTAVGDGDRAVRNTDNSTGVAVFQAVDGVQATTTIELDTASGGVTQQADRDVAAATLLLRGDAQYTLTNEDNAVAVLAADGGAGTGTGAGAMHYVNKNTLTVGAAAPVAGGDAVLGIVRTGDVALRALAGDLTLAESANVNEATLRLQAADNVTSLGGSTASAGTLGARAGGNVDLGIAVGGVSAKGGKVRLTAGNGYAITAVADADSSVLHADGSAGDRVFEAVDGLQAGTTVELITAAGEVVQQADRHITAANLLLRGNAQYSLINEGNAVAKLAADTGSGEIRYVNGVALAVDAVTPVNGGPAVLGISRGGDVALQTRAGDLSLVQDADVAAATLRLQAAEGNVLTAPSGGSAIAGTLGARASGNVDLAIAVGAVSAEGANVRLTSAGGYTLTAVGDSDRNVLQDDGASGAAVFEAVDGLEATAVTELATASGEVTQQADRNIATASLLLRGAAQVSLTNAGNQAGTLAADTGAAAIRYVDADALVVGEVTPVAGGAPVLGIQRGGDVSLRTLSGDLTLAQEIDVGSATLRLQASAGDVTADPTSATSTTVTAGALGARASGNVDLGIVVGLVSAAGANVRLTSSGDYAVSAVGDGDRNVLNANGAAGGVVFQATDGVNAITTVELDTAGGDVTQQAGRNIAASGLLLRGEAQYSLTNAGNTVGTLAADAGTGSGNGAGALRYVDANALQVGTVTPLAGGAAVQGITRSGDVSLRTVSGDLTLKAGVAAGTATLRLQATAGNIIGDPTSLANAGAIGARASGTVDLNVKAATVSAQANQVRLTSAGVYDIGAVSDGDRAVLNANGGIGDAVFQATDGLKAAGTVELDTASGGVSQLDGHDIAANSLLLRGAASYTLTHEGNSVATLAADSGGGVIRYVDADALTVGAVNTVGSGTAVTGINRSGDVTLRTVSGDLALDRNASVGEATLRLQAEGNILQADGAITAGSLGAIAGQSIALKSASNAVGQTVALRAGGNVWFEESNGYAIGTVAADGQEFTQTSGVSADAVAGTAELNTESGGVTQTQAVQAGQLLLRGSAAYTLTHAGNAVGAFAATSGGSADGAIAFVNSGNLVLQPMTGPSGLPAAGIQRSAPTRIDAAGSVLFKGNFQATGGSTVDITSHKAAEAIGEMRTDELDTYVVGRISPFDEPKLFTPAGNPDAIADGSRIRIAGAVISQDAGSTVTVDGNTALRLTSSGSGSITLAEFGNDFAGGTVTARSGGDTARLTLASAGEGELEVLPLLSRVEINGSVVNIGASGVQADVPEYAGPATAARPVSVGIEADLVRLGAEKITTGENFVVARYGANNLQPYEYQLPGLAIDMRGAPSYAQDNFGAIGDRGVAAEGSGPGLKVLVGYDPSRLGNVGWLMVMPSLFKGEGSLADGLGQFRSSQARISLTGPVVAKPGYLFASPGVQTNVPVFYNGETPLDPAQRSALSAIDSLQERLRREQVEQSVSTENVARDLRQGVIVEVGTGPAATSGSGAKPPETCGPAAAGLTCLP